MSHEIRSSTVLIHLSKINPFVERVFAIFCHMSHEEAIVFVEAANLTESSRAYI